jgi:cytochrome c biogenesis protein CcdA
MVAQGGSLPWGVLLLFLYSVGHSVLLLAAGTSVGLANGLASSSRLGRLGQVFKIAMGGAILLLSFYMFYLGF